MQTSVFLLSSYKILIERQNIGISALCIERHFFEYGIILNQLEKFLKFYTTFSKNLVKEEIFQ